jgi:hypothetical protein
MRKAARSQAAHTNNVFQFTLAGLIFFSLALVAGTSFIAFKFSGSNQPRLAESFAVDASDRSRSLHVGPWGTLLTRDIELERPAEYMTDEVNHPPVETWFFKGLTPEAVRSLLTSKGLAGAPLEALLAATNVTASVAGVRITPPGEFLEALDAPTRQKLFTGLAGQGANTYLDYPYIFPGGKMESIFEDPELDPDDVALLKKLVYDNGGAMQFSDYDYLLNRIPTVERRSAISRALSRQSAVFASLVIKPDTDIDKIAAYWGNMPNVRITDIRPLMEALKELPEGGNLSLFYLLPRFARDRLYTYPLPAQPGDPVMDCHWTTFNFSNDTPDNRFNDPNFAVKHIRENYYQITAPSLYGDVLLLLDDKGTVRHSALFLADDLVFTKNGDNFRQPWMLMHIPDLLATYGAAASLRPVYMRRKID